MSATGTGLPRQVEIYCVLAGSWQLPGLGYGDFVLGATSGALPCNREVLPLAEDVPGPKACSPCLENKEQIVFLPAISPLPLPRAAQRWSEPCPGQQPGLG